MIAEDDDGAGAGAGVADPSPFWERCCDPDPLPFESAKGQGSILLGVTRRRLRLIPVIPGGPIMR